MSAEVGDELTFDFLGGFFSEVIGRKSEDVIAEGGLFSKGDTEGVGSAELTDDAEEIPGARPEGEVARAEEADLFTELGMGGKVTAEGNLGSLSFSFGLDCEFGKLHAPGFAELHREERLGEDNLVNDEGFFLWASGADAEGNRSGGGIDGGEAIEELGEGVPCFAIGGDFQDAIGEGGAVIRSISSRGDLDLTADGVREGESEVVVFLKGAIRPKNSLFFTIKGELRPMLKVVTKAGGDGGAMKGGADGTLVGHAVGDAALFVVGKERWKTLGEALRGSFFFRGPVEFAEGSKARKGHVADFSKIVHVRRGKDGNCGLALVNFADSEETACCFALLGGFKFFGLGALILVKTEGGLGGFEARGALEFFDRGAGVNEEVIPEGGFVRELVFLEVCLGCGRLFPLVERGLMVIEADDR